MGFLGGAALLTAAVAVSKLLGALYKIPLGNLLGSRGTVSYTHLTLPTNSRV